MKFVRLLSGICHLVAGIIDSFQDTSIPAAMLGLALFLIGVCEIIEFMQKPPKSD